MVEGRDRRPELGYKLAMELKNAMEDKWAPNAALPYYVARVISLFSAFHADRNVLGLRELKGQGKCVF